MRRKVKNEKQCIGTKIVSMQSIVQSSSDDIEVNNAVNEGKYDRRLWTERQLLDRLSNLASGFSWNSDNEIYIGFAWCNTKGPTPFMFWNIFHILETPDSSAWSRKITHLSNYLEWLKTQECWYLNTYYIMIYVYFKI